MKTIIKNVAAKFLRKRRGKNSLTSAYGKSPMKHRSCVAFLLNIILILFPLISNAQIAKFSIVLLPDTQKYLQNNTPEMFTAQTQWIADNHLIENIKFVMHEGDIVHSNTAAEWQRANESMSILDGVVPYSLLPGNHDMGSNGSADTRDTSLYNEYFPVSRYQNTPTFGGVYEPEKYDNNYHTFSAGGTDWLVLSLEFAPRDPVIAWANAVVENHPNHRVIVVTHCYMHEDESRHSGQPWNPDYYNISFHKDGVNDGEEIWNKFVKLHSNISFVFSGHVLYDGLGRMVSEGLKENDVYQILTNFQSYNNGGDGYLRILEIDPSANTFTAKSYSPYLDEYKTDNQNQYTYNNVDLGPPNGGGGTTISVSDVQVLEGGGKAAFTISLSQASTSNVIIDYGTADNTAIAGSDYTTRTGRITFSPGQTSKVRTVNILQDTVQESNETFSMQLSRPRGASLGQASATATIVDDDTVVGDTTISVSDVQVSEGGGKAAFTISLSQASTSNVIIDYGTADNTAIAGLDYTTRTGRILFSPGQTSKVRTVVILQDTQSESDETFTMQISNPVNVTLGQASATATIVDDDAGDGGTTISVSDVQVPEGGGKAAFTISLSQASTSNVIIDYGTADNTAIAGLDYTTRTGRILFSPGQTSKVRTVNILQDNVQEPDETFTMQISNPVNVTLGQASATATIVDDDSSGG